MAVCLIAIFSRVGAQGLSIEVNGGPQGMRYTLANGKSQPQPGGSLGLTYAFGLGSHWSLRTGILGGLYRTQASLTDGTLFAYGQVDDAGSAFVYNVKTKEYKETQQFFTATVPLLLQYHTGGPGTRWYFEAGGKMVFPFNPTVEVTAQQLSLVGYYPDIKVNVSNLPQHGFGVLNGWKAAAAAEMKPAGAVSAGTGVSFAVSPHARLYAGVYADYGLTELRAKTDSLQLVTYSPAGINKVQPNGVLNTQNAGPATLFSFGIQLRLSFESTRPKVARRPKGAPEVQEPDSLPISDDEAVLLHRPIVFGITGETSVPLTQKSKLDDVAEIMKQHPGLRVSIVGHFCDSTTAMENGEVAAARSAAVADYLHSKGISRRRMDVSYVGEGDPFLSYDPAANYRNRRVVIKVE
ncbi:MAG TPA: OmpA family protein [Puia sp.]|nr:OmpA family protein [Puia sp.]